MDNYSDHKRNIYRDARGSFDCKCGCRPCCCLIPGQPGPMGPMGPQGIQGDTGPTGPAGGGIAGTVIPFSLSKYGAHFATDIEGDPESIHFPGFGGYGYSNIQLAPGVWRSGVIAFTSDMQYPSSFIMPRDAVLRRIQVVFSTYNGNQFQDGAVINPFVCIAIANPDADRLIFTVLTDTETFTEPYLGDNFYPAHTLRYGFRTDLNVPLAEGTLVGVLAGIMAGPAPEEQYGYFSLSGGLYLE